MTPTWRGRNKRTKVSDEEMKIALKEEKTIHAALSRLHMAAKGGNYKRATRLLREILNDM
jgi:hypothetical protein